MLHIKITLVSTTGNCARKNFMYLIEPNHLADYPQCGMQTKIKRGNFFPYLQEHDHTFIKRFNIRE
jgi:endonuclease I